MWVAATVMFVKFEGVKIRAHVAGMKGWHLTYKGLIGSGK